MIRYFPPAADCPPLVALISCSRLCPALACWNVLNKTGIYIYYISVVLCVLYIMNPMPSQALLAPLFPAIPPSLSHLNIHHKSYSPFISLHFRVSGLYRPLNFRRLPGPHLVLSHHYFPRRPTISCRHGSLHASRIPDSLYILVYTIFHLLLPTI